MFQYCFTVVSKKIDARADKGLDEKNIRIMRIISGIQPSGILHMGNYFGMMKPSIELQTKGEAFYFIVDYHALTSLHDAAELQKNVEEAVLDFMACGLDVSRAVFFRQSAVPEVHELTWYLSTVTPMGLLERCHSYKDKIARGISPSHALFAYPVLMAADILLYDADLVPVGQDQKQHVEVARDIAQKFNDRFSPNHPIFKLPEAQIQPETAIIPGLDGQKMSKSYGNTLELFGDEATLRKKIMSIPTDSTPVEAPKPTENSTLLKLASYIAPPDQLAEMELSMQKGGTGYGTYKKNLFEWYWEYFKPMREKRASLQREKGLAEHVLSEGAQKARPIAIEKLEKVRQAVGTKPSF